MPFVHAMVIDAMQSSVILHDHARAVFKRYPKAISFVARLFGWSRPATIAWLVIPIHIRIAIKGMLWRWPQAHICEEVREVIPPSRTHLDSASTVVGERRILRIVAAINGTRPRFVFSGQSVDAMPVPQLNLADLLAKCASAALAVARSKFHRFCDGLSAAITVASPCRVLEVIRWPLLKDQQSAKALAGQIKAFHSAAFYAALPWVDDEHTLTIVGVPI